MPGTSLPTCGNSSAGTASASSNSKPAVNPARIERPAFEFHPRKPLMLTPAVPPTGRPSSQPRRTNAAGRGHGTLTPDRNTRIPLPQTQIPRRISGAGSEFPDWLRPVHSPDTGSTKAQDRPGAMARVSGHRRSTGPIRPISPIRPVKRPRIRARTPAIIRENPCQSVAKKIVRGTPPAPADSRQS